MTVVVVPLGVGCFEGTVVVVLAGGRVRRSDGGRQSGAGWLGSGAFAGVSAAGGAGLDGFIAVVRRRELG
ncbi:hypothetical protein [Nonomuraea aridisoli]|uniref:Uncharacterized protein n=1 Tax=Nonomuraea aridisoli TaxID=2070368 RepID=A0A2W2DLC6_9ACTN|nr:hypothetical protein [Nonomuraea aridisoli]PZG12742.1 hypothetical protein C1J01_31890 [Nonomuraea aridisoli]